MKVLTLVNWARALWPLVSELLRDLMERHKGNVDAAASELRRIIDHGRRGEEAEAEFRARIAAAKQKP